jgi:hypothetical protein
MIPKPDKRERLLAELYHDNWTAGDSTRFATRAAAHARRRRTLRIALKSAGVAVLMLALVTALTFRPEPGFAPLDIPAPPAAPAAYEIISDTELLSLVEDRPLLLVQNANSPGHIVTFDY